MKMKDEKKKGRLQEKSAGFLQSLEENRRS
jgi:hypothetical protein